MLTDFPRAPSADPATGSCPGEPLNSSERFDTRIMVM